MAAYPFLFPTGTGRQQFRPRGIGGGDEGSTGEQCGYFLGRQRRAEQVSLAMRAAELAQTIELLGELDAFRDQVETEVEAEVGDRARHDRVALALADPVDERLCDLQHVDRELLEVPQRGVRGSEVVDRDLHSELLQRAEAFEA